ncbi:MAG: type II toxin-antitoxin system HicA family toxin [Chloroflexi bacterium]|nr:type II toxin-antitoxin system HicA family toxin [Chloroflexota bacterium]
MSRMPSLGWRQIAKALQRAGFFFHRRKGNHMFYYLPGTTRTVVVPRHREIKSGTLREILREADLARDEFRRLLD